MGGFFGFMLLKQTGCFIRWLIKGANGKYKEFYENESLVFVDDVIGAVVSFGIMLAIIELFNLGNTPNG